MFSPETFESPGQPVERKKQLKNSKTGQKLKKKSFFCKRGPFLKGWGGGLFVSHWDLSERREARGIFPIFLVTVLFSNFSIEQYFPPSSSFSFLSLDWIAKEQQNLLTKSGIGEVEKQSPHKPKQPNINSFKY